jgi:hypothetical protein
VWITIATLPYTLYIEEAEPKTFEINRMNGIGDDGKNEFKHGKIITTTNNVYTK